MTVKLNIPAAEAAMLALVKEGEPGTRYFFNGLIEHFLAKHGEFQYVEAEEAARSLLQKKVLRFVKHTRIERVTDEFSHASFHVALDKLKTNGDARRHEDLETFMAQNGIRNSTSESEFIAVPPKILQILQEILED